jgi:hypothetical protein
VSFIALHDSQTYADQVLDGLGGWQRFRGGALKAPSNRLSHRGRRVIIYFVFDGRRDVQSFPQRRLLR